MSAFGGKKPKRVQAGQPISAKGYNRLIDSVRPVGVGGNAHVLSMHGMTFVTPKKATRRHIVQYTDTEPFFRTHTESSGTAKHLRWNSDNEEFETVGENFDVYHALFRAYAFEDDYLEIAYINGRWEAVDGGTTFVRARLKGTLEPGGEAAADVYEFAASDWADAGYDIDVVEGLGLTETLPAEHSIYCTWHDKAQLWLVTGATCPTAS